MGLSGRGSKGIAGSNIWPGFVDAMTTLLMILMFVLSVFMILQFTLRETITTQSNELADLTAQVADLANTLGLARKSNAELQSRVEGLGADLAGAKKDAETQAALIANLTGQLNDRSAALNEAQAKITSFEAQVASLLAERDSARSQATDLAGQRDKLVSDQEALNLALAKARTEVDAQTEQARLAAARREALDALVADLKKQNADAATAAGAAATEAARKLSEAEATRLAEAEAARMLRERLKGATDELTSMTLALEAERKKAEDMLTLLAAAEAARKGLDDKLAAALVVQSATAEELAAAKAAADAVKADSVKSGDVQKQLADALAAKLAAETAAADRTTEAERQAALLATANSALASEKAISAEGARKIELLNQQVVALRTQLNGLQQILDASAQKDADAKVQIEALGSQLNAALAQVAAEQRRRADLEEAERKRLEVEAASLKDQTKELAAYRSEFFGKLSQILTGRNGVRVVGDRFVFSSEVLFQQGSADLSEGGKAQIANVVKTLEEVAAVIPPDIDWILRVDGHTDNTPVIAGAKFKDNWELSQARALSVVRFMQDDLGFPPNRLAATGFGEYWPVAEGDTPEAKAANRRIELKLTER